MSDIDAGGGTETPRGFAISTSGLTTELDQTALNSAELFEQNADRVRAEAPQRKRAPSPSRTVRSSFTTRSHARGVSEGKVMVFTDLPGLKKWTYPDVVATYLNEATGPRSLEIHKLRLAKGNKAAALEVERIVKKYGWEHACSLD